MTAQATAADATDATASASSTDPMAELARQSATPTDTQATDTTEHPATDEQQSTDSDAAKDETKTGDGDAATDESAAELAEYKDFDVPEGYNLVPEILDEFKAAALGAKLTQEQAQHLVDMGAKLSARVTQQAWDVHNEKIAEWQSQSMADKEFGGDKLNENLALASKAMDAFATPELKQVLDQTGLGNHPELIRAFVRVGRQISEDRLVPGGSMPVGDSRTIAERLYPN